MSEFGADLVVWMVDVDASGKPVAATRSTLNELLPLRFVLE